MDMNARQIIGPIPGMKSSLNIRRGIRENTSVFGSGRRVSRRLVLLCPSGGYSTRESGGGRKIAYRKSRNNALRGFVLFG
jgi:hypothetical protein